MRPTCFSAILGVALSVVATAALTSCSTTRPADDPLGETTRTTVYKDGVPGGIIRETTRLRATVVAIDATNRAITIAVPDGREKVIGCGPEVVNFEQIRVGDHVEAVITSELTLAMAGSDLPRFDSRVTQAALAPQGDRPGGVATKTQEYTATITDINRKGREVTLRLPDDSKRTFQVRPDTDLSRRKVGEQVAVRVAVAVAISVEPPESRRSSANR
ncbi:MAG TPA: hypothetical protein VFZ59_17425 [Verrucomicrobiae bacterium]|nr:hypothetical protein [Verrucomicrobiae bacterium]